jgi:hypothetical protein
VVLVASQNDLEHMHWRALRRALPTANCSKQLYEYLFHVTPLQSPTTTLSHKGKSDTIRTTFGAREQTARRNESKFTQCERVRTHHEVPEKKPIQHASAQHMGDQVCSAFQPATRLRVTTTVYLRPVLFRAPRPSLREKRERTGHWQDARPGLTKKIAINPEYKSLVLRIDESQTRAQHLRN